VSTSADGTFIRTRDGPVEVKLGMWWTGAHLQSPSAIHKKFLLQGKGSYASTEGADLFGQTFYALAARRGGITRAGEVFFISDGAAGSPTCQPTGSRPPRCSSISSTASSGSPRSPATPIVPRGGEHG